MKRIFFATILLTLSCASDTGAIFVTEKQSDSDDTALVEECPTLAELKSSRSCSEAKLSLMPKKKNVGPFSISL